MAKETESARVGYTRIASESGQKDLTDRRRWDNIYFAKTAVEAYPLISSSSNWQLPTIFRADISSGIELRPPNEIQLLKDLVRKYPLQSLEITLGGQGDLFMDLLEKLSCSLKSEQVAVLLDEPRINRHMGRVFVNYIVLNALDYVPINHK